MKKQLQKARPLGFIALVILVFYIFDFACSLWAPAESSAHFTKNDYEKTILSHDGATCYDKVLFGNSTLISSYIEGQSSSGYVNFGLDYGTVCDLDQMLDKGYLDVSQELVIVLNYFVLMDTLDTNPTYPWHRQPLEPYVFFQRDRLLPAVNEVAGNILHFRPPLALSVYSDYAKTVYHGVMTDEELAEKSATHSELYWGLDESSYQKNLAALQSVADWCAENGVRLRVVWGPWNPDIDMPDMPRRIMELANEELAEKNVEVYDMTDALPRKYFYDIGHLNYEYGAVYFTEVFDKWLNS